MPADRLLGVLLRALQTYADDEDTPKLLGTAVSLLTTLNNPLNVTLLTSQLLSARAIWTQPDGLRTSTRCLSVFHSAAQALLRHEKAVKDKSEDHDFAELQHERTLPKDEWIRAVINGADDRSPRWRHLLVLGGLILGFGPPEDENISRSLRGTLERAFVTAANLALEETPQDDGLGQQTLTLALNHCFANIADHERDQMNFDALLPVLMRSTLHSSEGLRSGYFLGAIDQDVKPVSNTQFRWSERSVTFQETQKMLSSPIVSSLGPLSRLIAHSIESVSQSGLVVAAMEDLDTFARTLHLQWRQNKLSEIDPSEEKEFLDGETREKTLPQLWTLLRSTVFAAIIILRSAIGRTLGDPALVNGQAGPNMAGFALRSLRSLYFVSTRMNATSFSQYNFVYLTAIDMLTAYPQQSLSFIDSIKPNDLASVPKDPEERCLDLYFLNTSEHFTLVLPAHTNEELLVAAASPYLAAGGNNHLIQIFEAAHSVMLAVFSAPQNTDLTTKHLPFYIDALFKVFPHNLTARQFRLAFKTLLRLTSPPSVLSRAQPMLSAVLLELLHERAGQAGTTPVFPRQTPTAQLEEEKGNDEGEGAGEAAPELSEQAIVVLTVIDTLTQIELDLLAEWLPIAAELVNAIDDDFMREHCKAQFWHTLVDGEMDPNRSQVCHSWWSTSGGREFVLFGRENGGGREDPTYTMSGALPSDSRDSKL